MMLLLIALTIPLSFYVLSRKNQSLLFMGGTLHTSAISEKAMSVTNQDGSAIYERYRRPSNKKPFPNPYSFSDFEQTEGQAQTVTKTFNKSEDLILAYFGILNQASNMIGYSGGCGSIGVGLHAYPYAYSLLTPELTSKMSLEQFTDSFKGIGYITLLKVIPAYPSDGDHFMIEIETIQGEPESENEPLKPGGRFVYYYGIMSTQKTDNGYLLSGIDLMPEDFLCAPEHRWFYMSDAVVQIVYGDNLHIIDKIEKTVHEGSIIYIYASGNGNHYRFDFVRITNGYDIMLHENIYINGAWKEVNLKTKDWYTKLT